MNVITESNPTIKPSNFSFTNQQLDWIADHDWYVAYNKENNVMKIYDYCTERDGWFNFYIQFDSLKELRVWAGY